MRRLDTQSELVKQQEQATAQARAELLRLSQSQRDTLATTATYAYHLTRAHAFVDGNKRVAAAVTETFLESNGSQLAMTDAELVARSASS